MDHRQLQLKVDRHISRLRAACVYYAQNAVFMAERTEEYHEALQDELTCLFSAFGQYTVVTGKKPKVGKCLEHIIRITEPGLPPVGWLRIATEDANTLKDPLVDAESQIVPKYRNEWWLTLGGRGGVQPKLLDVKDQEEFEEQIAIANGRTKATWEFDTHIRSAAQRCKSEAEDAWARAQQRKKCCLYLRALLSLVEECDRDGQSVVEKWPSLTEQAERHVNYAYQERASAGMSGTVEAPAKHEGSPNLTALRVKEHIQTKKKRGSDSESTAITSGFSSNSLASRTGSEQEEDENQIRLEDDASYVDDDGGAMDY
ncbi:hypothetical protein BDN72DRAFT_905453 [Pluteus cervinus]|uniref:Uncharacterized protein n=1 Tax=Pluteus cervinus TaxID=181527 RepID=A0ACD3A2K8_9AGAR|nr:hypothetical protein BDN72DRAFT_905453 [Pluteus cervinus]